jgi:hypothetical protein
MAEYHQRYHQTIPENRLTPLNTGFNMLVLTGPAKTQTKYGWLCTLLEWTNTTRHIYFTCNLWPKPETTTSQELNKCLCMTNNGVHTAIRGNPIQPQQRRSPGQIHQQNKQHQYQYQPPNQQIDPTLATTHTFICTSSQK